MSWSFLLGCICVWLFILFAGWWHYGSEAHDEELTTTGFLEDCYREEAEELERIAASYDEARSGERHADV